MLKSAGAHRGRPTYRSILVLSLLTLSLAAEAGVSMEEVAPQSPMNLAQLSDSQNSNLLAQNKRRKRRKGSRRRKRGDSSSTSSSSRSVVNSGIKAGAGLVFGIDGATPFMLGGDYTMPLAAVNNLLLDVGGNYWSYSVGGASVTFITIEGGVDYHYPIASSGKIVGGARLSYVNASGSGVSDSKFGLTLLGGYEHNLGGSAVGAEFRIPMISDVDVTYLFGYYKFFL
ncbi:MAG: hypothetical protein H6624_05780 [Bdellovibrionaceae bacterium]|nr:hypothetical protein [Bdellovibrionales bacterium]MCB9083831.1 hypothetical protein [Pseudobdellovibrionaceae bacterium]